MLNSVQLINKVRVRQETEYPTAAHQLNLISISLCTVFFEFDILFGIFTKRIFEKKSRNQAQLDKTFGICFCVILEHYDQSFIFEKETGH